MLISHLKPPALAAILLSTFLSAAPALGAPEDVAYDRMFHDLLAGDLFLRQGQVYRLERLSTDPVPAERLIVEGPVLTRDQLRALHGGH
jgi:hypothetical protein